MDGAQGAAALKIRPDEVRGGPRDLEVAGRLHAQGFGHQARFQPRNAVNGQHGALSPGVRRGCPVQGQQQRLVQFGQPGAKVHSAAFQQT